MWGSTRILGLPLSKILVVSFPQGAYMIFIVSHIFYRTVPGLAGSSFHGLYYAIHTGVVRILPFNTLNPKPYSQTRELQE